MESTTPDLSKTDSPSPKLSTIESAAPGFSNTLAKFLMLLVKAKLRKTFDCMLKNMEEVIAERLPHVNSFEQLLNESESNSHPDPVDPFKEVFAQFQIGAVEKMLQVFRTHKLPPEKQLYREQDGEWNDAVREQKLEEKYAAELVDCALSKNPETMRDVAKAVHRAVGEQDLEELKYLMEDTELSFEEERESSLGLLSYEKLVAARISKGDRESKPRGVTQ